MSRCSINLAFALLLSLLLHLLLLVPGASWQPPANVPENARAPLDARLLPAAQNHPPKELLKNTLSEEPAPAASKATDAARAAKTTAGHPPSAASAAPQLAQQTAQRILAAHVYYPPEAVARGLEGEVRLLLTLAPDGRLTDALIAASSGHALLDQAALDAVQTMGELPDTGVRELILPVVFRLR